MILNYFKIAWRNLKKQAFFTFLNTIGLSIGMAGSLLICLYIYDELNRDTMFPDADRIHRINLDYKFGGKVGENAEVSAPVAATLEQDVPMVEITTRFRNNYSNLIRKAEGDVNVKEFKTTFVDPTFFEMFGLDLLVGDVKTALNEPNTLILSKTAGTLNFSKAEITKTSALGTLFFQYSIFSSTSSWEDLSILFKSKITGISLCNMR